MRTGNPIHSDRRTSGGQRVVFGPIPTDPNRPHDTQAGGFRDQAPEISPEGRFQIERLIPGQRYSAEVYRGSGNDAGPAFENVVLQAGEVRDLGDIRTRKLVDVIGK